jgi:hypothetical protein
MEREPVTDAIPGNFLEAGESTMFSIIAPVDFVWRVRCEVAQEDTGTKGALQRLKLCWRPLALAASILYTGDCRK